MILSVFTGFVLIGDFNYLHIDWKAKQCVSNYCIERKSKSKSNLVICIVPYYRKHHC